MTENAKYTPAELAALEESHEELLEALRGLAEYSGRYSHRSLYPSEQENYRKLNAIACAAITRAAIAKVTGAEKEE